MNPWIWIIYCYSSTGDFISLSHYQTWSSGWRRCHPHSHIYTHKHTHTHTHTRFFTLNSCFFCFPAQMFSILWSVSHFPSYCSCSLFACVTLDTTVWITSLSPLFVRPLTAESIFCSVPPVSCRLKLKSEQPTAAKHEESVAKLCELQFNSPTVWLGAIF